MAEVVELCAFVYPDPAKLARVRELLINLCNKLKENSHGITRYVCYESVEDEKPIFIFFEKYENVQALEDHRKVPVMVELHKLAVQEALVVKPQKLLMMNRIGGWLDNE